LLFVIDTHTEDLSVREANRMGVPVVGIVDTNADPDVVVHPIPANDDAVGSIELLTNAVVDAWIEGKTGKEVRSASSGQAKKTTKAKEPTKEGKAAEEAADAPVEEAEKSPVKTTKRTKKGDVK
jgi:small subunit ribosomal protein S2